MSQLADIQAAQKSLEESFMQRMSQLETQIQGSGPAKDTVAKVAEEFRTFRELMFNMLGLLRQQIYECSKTMDNLETRHRRKALIFTGVSETENEDCRDKTLNIINVKLGLNNLTASSIKSCHRLGTFNKERHRPILLRFSDLDCRSAVWRAKTKLKGSSIAIREFLTKTRQSTFVKARQHFGMRACWTQDGVIVIKLADGSRAKVSTIEELNVLAQKHPKVSENPPFATRTGGGSSSTTGLSKTLRRN